MATTDGAGFSRQWDNIYKTGTHRSVWPWSDLISLCERWVRPRFPEAEGMNILEVGCGYGANIPYLKTLGVVHGVDGSETSIKANRERFPELSYNLRVVDFTKTLGFNKKFQLICDRASITHNTDADMRKCLRLIHQALVPGGVLIGVAWYGKSHTEYKKGEASVDKHTRTKHKDGPFKDTGNIHFTDEVNLRDILSDFEILVLEHKMTEQLVPADHSINVFYNFAALKAE